MQKLMTATGLISLILIAGCATSTNNGIVQTGADTYRVANLGRYADYSSSALKARLHEDAFRHCTAQNRIMVPVTDGDQNGAAASNSSAEIQFRCVARNQAHSPGRPAPTL